MCGSLGIQHCALEQTEYQPKFIALISFDIFPIRICPTWINVLHYMGPWFFILIYSRMVEVCPMWKNPDVQMDFVENIVYTGIHGNVWYR